MKLTLICIFYVSAFLFTFYFHFFVFIDLFLSPCLYIYLSIYLSTYLSICISMYLTTHLFIYLFFLSIYPSIYLSVPINLSLSFSNFHISLSEQMATQLMYIHVLVSVLLIRGVINAKLSVQRKFVCYYYSVVVVVFFLADSFCNFITSIFVINFLSIILVNNTRWALQRYFKEKWLSL